MKKILLILQFITPLLFMLSGIIHMFRGGTIEGLLAFVVALLMLIEEKIK